MLVSTLRRRAGNVLYWKELEMEFGQHLRCPLEAIGLSVLGLALLLLIENPVVK